MNKVEIIKAVCGIVFIVALIFAIGFTGSLDAGAITVKAFAIREAICYGLLYASYKIIEII